MASALHGELRCRAFDLPKVAQRSGPLRLFVEAARELALRALK